MRYNVISEKQKNTLYKKIFCMTLIINLFRNFWARIGIMVLTVITILFFLSIKVFSYYNFNDDTGNYDIFFNMLASDKGHSRACIKHK